MQIGCLKCGRPFEVDAVAYHTAPAGRVPFALCTGCKQQVEKCPSLLEKAPPQAKQTEKKTFFDSWLGQFLYVLYFLGTTVFAGVLSRQWGTQYGTLKGMGMGYGVMAVCFCVLCLIYSLAGLRYERFRGFWDAAAFVVCWTVLLPPLFSIIGLPFMFLVGWSLPSIRFISAHVGVSIPLFLCALATGVILAGIFSEMAGRVLNSGSEIDSSHEWKGWRTGPATRREVFEKYHGLGSFDSHRRSSAFTLAAFGLLAILLIPIGGLLYFGKIQFEGHQLKILAAAICGPSLLFGLFSFFVGKTER